MATNLPSELKEEYFIGQLDARYLWGICSAVGNQNPPKNGVLLHLDVLPNVCFGADDTHIRLVCTTIYENAIVHLKESIPRIVLKLFSKEHESCGRENSPD